jgi:L-fuconolactonase
MIDSHFHVWQLARGDYHWLTPTLAPIYRDITVSDWIDQAAPLGVRQGILVQAAATREETLYLLDQADCHPQQILGVVGWVDLEAADAIEQIASLARHPKLRGIRPMLQDIADPDWILRPQVVAALATLAPLNLSFDALIKPHHLLRIGRLVKQLPDLRIIIDHAAKPDIVAHHAGDGFEEWAQTMAWLSEYPNVWCKLSGLITESGTPPSLEACEPYIGHILTCFYGRTLWGSDWPVLALAGTYPAWLQRCQQLVQQHRAMHDDVFHHAARHAYGL